jgi:hypothetical protein
MADLIDMAIKMGPYDVAWCNCHHAAQRLFNAFAVKNVPDSDIPNRQFTAML